MAETEQMARMAEDAARRSYAGSREQIEARNDRDSNARLDQAANKVIPAMGIHAGMTDEMITAMAAGWAVQNGHSSEAAQIIGVRVLSRIRNAHLYGPLELDFNTDVGGRVGASANNLNQGSREALARRIAIVTGDNLLAARIVQAICGGL